MTPGRPDRYRPLSKYPLLAGVGMGWSFVPGLRLRGDGLAALALPPVHVSTPTKDVGWWGAPALILSLGIEVLWSP